MSTAIHNADAVAIRGTDAYMRQPRLPISERFLCPVDSAHGHNRKVLKKELQNKGITILVSFSLHVYMYTYMLL